jgi:hypothetical protein
MGRTRYTQDEQGYVHVEYPFGDRRVRRTFMCPQDGGYVRELTHPARGEWTQVCHGLGRQGPTLTCPSRDKLLDLVKRELRKRRRV